MSESTNKYRTQAIDPAILSVLDVTTNGKVVSADDWRYLWETTFKSINGINEYCLTLNEIKANWEASEAKLNVIVEDFQAKYNALEKSFIHYGEEAPQDEATRLWAKPVSKVDDNMLVTRAEFNKCVEALQNKPNTIVIPYSGALFYELSRYDTEQTEMRSYSLYGNSTQVSSSPTPTTNPKAIASVENPTISISGSHWNGELEFPTVYAFNGITLKGIGGGKDELVMKDGRIKLIQRVLCIKDLSGLDFETSNANGFKIDLSALDVKVSNRSSLCNMFKYSSSTTATTKNCFRVSNNCIITRNVSEIKSGMTREEFKNTYASQMEFYLPLVTPIETDVTERFLDNLNIPVFAQGYVVKFDSEPSYIQDAITGTEAPTTETVGEVGSFYLNTPTQILYECTEVTDNIVDDVVHKVYTWVSILKVANLSSGSFSYDEDTKCYIDQKFNEIATALVANA